MTDIKEVFGKKLNEARRFKGLKQKELAKALQITPQTLSAYETGKKLPTIEKAVNIATTLGVSLNWLFGFDTVSTGITGITGSETIYTTNACSSRLPCGLCLITNQACPFFTQKFEVTCLTNNITTAYSSNYNDLPD